jgi:hypothetical protein
VAAVGRAREAKPGRAAMYAFAGAVYDFTLRPMVPITALEFSPRGESRVKRKSLFSKTRLDWYGTTWHKFCCLQGAKARHGGRARVTFSSFLTLE